MGANQLASAAVSEGSPVGIPKDMDHEKFMRLAMEQGKKSEIYPFGAVIVNMHTKDVISGGYMRVDKCPIWHGEMAAINACPAVDTGFSFKDVILYTTGESCPMCMSAILWTGIPMVVYASSMPYLLKQNIGFIDIRATAINEASKIGHCQVLGGVLEKECNQMFLDAVKAKSGTRPKDS